MINVFVLENGRLNQIPIESRIDPEGATFVWVDLIDPNDDEPSRVKSKKYLRLDLTRRG